MSNLKYGPKIVPLAEDETINSIERWRQSVLYLLRLNEEFRPYMNQDFEFGRKTKTKPFRKLTNSIRIKKDDKGVVVKEEDGSNAVEVIVSQEDKCYIVDLMLEQIANFCPLIPRYDITRDSSSLSEVWNKIRLYYNLEKSGALLNECWNISRKEDESPQALFARLKQAYNDNLITANTLHHVDGVLEEDEEMSPTLESNIVLHWLNILHPKLRAAVTQRFATQLRSNTYASLFPEISRSVGTILEELNNDASVSRIYSTNNRSNYSKPSFSARDNQSKFNGRSYLKKSCDYCKLTGKKAFNTHSIETCLFIKRENRRNQSYVKQVDCEEEDVSEHYNEFFEITGENLDQEAARVPVTEHIITATVNTSASPVISLNKNDKSYEFIVDTGLTGSNIITEKAAREFNATVRPTFQRARAADGRFLNIIGETDTVLYRKNKPYQLNALVCADQMDLLAGMPFLKKNDIAIRPATDELIFEDREKVKYDPVRQVKPNNAYRVTQFSIHSNSRQVILPNQTGTFSVKGVVAEDTKVVVEPRWDSGVNKKASKDSELWPSPQIVPVVNGAVTLTNRSGEPIVVGKYDQIAQIQPEIKPEPKSEPYMNSGKPTFIPESKKSTPYSDNVSLNPDGILSPSEESSFSQLLQSYDEVFSSKLGTYNGKYGACSVEVNIKDTLPPQHKGRVPFYSRTNLQELQDKFDELEMQGVFSRPQDIGITVENTSPSFLVNKQNSSEKRLVTDFSSISDYCRPTPSLLPNVDSTLRTIGRWRYIIKSDMTKAYWQLKLKNSSKRYCGVHTPYKGLRVYNVGCMGLPGVEVALEELTCLILGDLVKEGRVAKIADDLLIGGNSPEELLRNFEEVLHRLLECNIRLSATKTIIAPASLVILGWVWSSGKLSASPHRLSALSSCSPPDTVTAMKSYTGAYRFLSRVLPGYAKLLAPLEAAVKGKKGNEKITWTDELHSAFLKAKEALRSAKTITIPVPSDVLWIVTDAAIRPFAVGATLYVVRDGKPLLGGFFNCKLPEYQSRWLPCEVEALGIAASLNHYAPLIIQSDERPHVLTDSKACVQAVARLRRGEFSASSRLSTFLSHVSRYNARIQHLAGEVNLPSDYASRHPLLCNDSNSCQVCKFASESMDSVVNKVTVLDVLEGRVKLPFTTRSTWREVQQECRDLRKVSEHIKRGTKPHKKAKNLKTVRKYLNSDITVSADGLLTKYSVKALSSSHQIVVPQQVLHGLLTALHLVLHHATLNQLLEVFHRYFFALGLEKAASAVTSSCHHCFSIKEVPQSLISQSTAEPPSHVGCTFSADIIKRCKQKIFIIREVTTSYTLAEFVKDESAKEVSKVLIKLSNLLKPSKLTPMSVKLDPAPAHKSMMKNVAQGSSLRKNNILLELGHSKNPNKNPCVDKAIKEFHRELLNISPEGGPVSDSQLSEAVASLNSRIRASGMSSFEMWTQRDQVSGNQLPIKDRDVILQQHERRKANNRSSERSKAGGKAALPSPKVQVGSLVYLYGDRDKTAARQRYIVVEVNHEGLHKLRKFSSDETFRKEIFEVKPNDIYCVPQYYPNTLPSIPDESSDEDYEDASSEFQSHKEVSTEVNDQDADPRHRGDESSSSENSGSSEEDLSEDPDSSDSEDNIPPAVLTNPPEDVEQSTMIRLRRRKSGLNYRDNRPYSARR